MDNCTQCGSPNAKHCDNWNDKWDTRLCNKCYKSWFDEQHRIAVIESKESFAKREKEWAKEVLNNYPKALTILNETN